MLPQFKPVQINISPITKEDPYYSEIDVIAKSNELRSLVIPWHPERGKGKIDPLLNQALQKDECAIRLKKYSPQKNYGI
jgi:hypothetical protein